MAFDVEGAKAAGYSDAEIADHLAGATKFDTAGARKAGYSDSELIAHLSGTPAAAPGITNLPPGAPLADVLATPDAQNADNPGGNAGAAPNFAAARQALQTGAGGVAARVGEAAVQGAQASAFLTPEAKAAAEAENQKTWMGRNVVSPLVAASELPFRAANALGAGLGQTAYEVGNAYGGPGAGRDAFMLNQLLPEALRGVPRVGGNPPVSERPAFVSERTAPAAVPGGSTLDRMTQLIQHDNAETPPAPVPAAPGAAPASAATPRTVPEAKAVASAYYGIADAAGGAQFPDAYVNNLVDAFKRAAPQGEAGRTLFGDTVPAQLAAKAEGLRGKPMTLADAQEIDEGIGSLISNQYRPNGQLTDEGRVLFDLQTELRDLTMHAAPTTEAAGGVEALKAGRAAWSQAQKMQDLQRIWDRAQMNERPDTAFRTGVRTLLSNEKRVRGYSDAEKAAVRAAADRGTLGEVLHVFGSKLIPIAAGVAEASSGGLTAGLAAAGTAHLGTAGFRNLSTRLQASRFENAMTILGRRVPPLPTNDFAPP